jgi:hypothetical protein
VEEERTMAKFQYTVLSTTRGGKNRRFYEFHETRQAAEETAEQMTVRYGRTHRFGVAAVRVETEKGS